MSDVESDDGKRASKKRKASRACDRCNSQHQPCDNAVPKCSVCVRAGTECTYNRPVRKRGPRSGYTGQNGERLLAIVLQAKPELEDVVLQILRGGTYGNTGLSNLDYYRNNDNQTELVNRFNESRLGRFLQHGESPDLLLPALDQELPAIPSQGRSETHFTHTSNAARHTNLATNHVPPTRTNRSISSSSVAHSGGASSVVMNPHGAPQNPGDIYVQSEDIRKRVFNPSQNHNQNHNQSHNHNYDQVFNQETPLDAGWDRSPSVLTVPQSTAYGSNGSADGYIDHRRHGSSNHGMLERPNGLGHSTDMSQMPFQPQLTLSTPMEQGNFDFHLADTSRWLESIPTDTLLNLGFMPGDGMAEDFFELCENPDPIDTTPGASVNQTEDEEAIWRRLVMRGRFV